MAIDLLNTIQKNLGYPEKKKIDPNTEETVADKSKPNEHRLFQSAVPAVLAGIYKLAKNEDGIKDIASEFSVSNWVDIIFGVNKNEVLKNITDYSFYNAAAVEDKMNEAAAEAIRLIRENSKDDSNDNHKVNFAGMKIFISQQRNNILPYLPPALHIGNMLDDTTIDDATTKMEGPVSSLMHKIEAGFGTHETKEDAERKHHF